MEKSKSLKQRNISYFTELPFLLDCGIGLVSGFALSMARLFGSISPFAAAFVAAMPLNASVCAAVGSVIGYLVRYDSAWTVRMLAVLAACAVINHLVSKNLRAIKNAVIAPLNAGGCMLLTGLTVLFAQGFNADGLVLYICESIISAAGAAMFETARNARELMIKKEPLPNKLLTGVLVSFCMLLISLEGLTLGGISPSRAMACFTVLCAAKWGGITGGSICASSMGFAMSIGSSMPFLSSAYTFGGLVAGLFSPLGRFAQTCAFCVCSAVTVLTNTGSANLMPALYETALAAIAFMLVPQKIFSGGAVYFTGRQTLPEFESMRKSLILRLNGVSAGLDEVADALEQISSNMTKLDRKSTDPVSEETRKLVRDQFATLSMAVDSIAQRFVGRTRFDTVTASKVGFVLESYGIKPLEIICSQTDDISRIEISAEKLRGKFSRSALMGDMENACGYKLCNPTIREENEKTMLTFVKKPQLNLLIGKAQHTAVEDSMCGDSFDCFSDKDGNKVIVLSDGMGTGPRAAVDGAVAAWLFSKLITAGLNFDSSLRLSNSALIVKSNDETVATIDAVKFDLHTGQVNFFKAGAGVSLVSKGKKLYTIGKPSMPLGILREIEFSKDEMTLSKGDVLLMMSDGVENCCYGAIADELRRINKKDPTAFAERVVEIAREKCSDKRPDDITVICVIVL